MSENINKKLNRLHIAILLIMGLLVITLSLLWKVSEKIEQNTLAIYNNGEPSLYAYVDEFVKDADRYGYDVSYIYNYPVIIQFEQSDDFAGQAYGMNDDELVLVAIDSEEWYLLGLLERKQLMYHELFHDIFNLEHPETEVGIMSHDGGYYYSVHEVEKDLEKVFEEIGKVY